LASALLRRQTFDQPPAVVIIECANLTRQNFKPTIHELATRFIRWESKELARISESILGQAAVQFLFHVGVIHKERRNLQHKGFGHPGGRRKLSDAVTR